MWARRHPLNVPGIFFTAETDTADDARNIAPEFIGVDERWHSFVCRQPTRLEQVALVSNAAALDPMQEFSASGLSLWTMDAIAEWLSNHRSRLELWLDEAIQIAQESGRHAKTLAGLKEYYELELDAYISEFSEFITSRRA